MRRAIKARFAIVFLMILSLGIPLGLAAEDIPETAYDESEAQPYLGASLSLTVVPRVAARIPQKVLSSLHLKPGAPSLFAPARVHDTDANRSTDARVSLALLCTLLC